MSESIPIKVLVDLQEYLIKERKEIEALVTVEFFEGFSHALDKILEFHEEKSEELSKSFAERKVEEIPDVDMEGLE